MAEYPIVGDHIVCDPVTRIEGHLGVNIELAESPFGTSGALHDAFPFAVGANTQVFSTMYRGFENILKNRDPRDAIQITQRICGVCPVPHGMAATFAVENAMGYSPDAGANTGHSSGVNEVARLVRHLTLGAEFMMSALTHFYALSALDLVQGPEMAPWTPFWDDSYYDELLLNDDGGGPNSNFSYDGEGLPANPYTAVVTDYVLALRTRTQALDIGAIFGGRLPIASSFTAGGVTKIPTTDDIANARLLLTGNTNGHGTAGVKGYIENNYVPMTEIVSVLHGLADNENNQWGPAADTVTTLTSGTRRSPYSCTGTGSLSSGLGLGKGCRNFYAAGGFDGAGDFSGGDNNARVFPRGVVTGADHDLPGTLADVDPTIIKESIKYARYAQGEDDVNEDLNPLNGVTIPEPDKADAYTWHKATRYGDTVVELGPLARMWVKGVHGDTDGYCAGMTKYMSSHAFASADGLLPLPDLGPDGYIAGALETVYEVDAGTFTDNGIPYACGISVMDRHRARALEAKLIAAKMCDWLDELEAIVSVPGWEATHERYTEPNGTTVHALEGLTADGFGMTEAPRGAVHHWIKIVDGKIDNYQVQAPTTWNCSGRDSHDQRGPVEEALFGAPVRGIKSDGKLVPVEALIIIHSFDPCIACSVHVIEPEDKAKMKEFKVNKGGVE